MEGSDGEQPDDTGRAREPGSRLRRWVLLEADRWAVAAISLGLFFGSLIALGAVDGLPLQQTIQNATPVTTLFQAFVLAIITGVTLVVSINQLVLSQELGSVGDQRERMAGAMAFRRDVEEVLDSTVSPPEPSAFLRALVEVARDRAAAIQAVIPAGSGTEVRAGVNDYVDSLTENADSVDERLEGTQFGTFDVVFAALDFNYSWKIYEARRLRNEHADVLSDDAEAAFDDLIEVLEFFGPAREHVKTLYFQWELINLSRALLYVSVPALVVAVGAVIYLDDPGAITGATAGVANIVWVVTTAATIALVPFMLLLSYVLRIATVAKRTLAIGPFILQEAERSDDIDWE